jgi:hypothetical protein
MITHLMSKLKWEMKMKVKGCASAAVRGWYCLVMPHCDMNTEIKIKITFKIMNNQAHLCCVINLCIPTILQVQVAVYCGVPKSTTVPVSTLPILETPIPILMQNPTNPQPKDIRRFHITISQQAIISSLIIYTGSATQNLSIPE